MVTAGKRYDGQLDRDAAQSQHCSSKFASYNNGVAVKVDVVRSVSLLTHIFTTGDIVVRRIMTKLVRIFFPNIALLFLQNNWIFCYQQKVVILLYFLEFEFFIYILLVFCSCNCETYQIISLRF